MSSSRKKAINRTIQFGIASLAGNAFMAFLVYKLITKENPRVTQVDMSLMIAIILLTTMIEVIVYWGNQKQVIERQHILRVNLEEILKGQKVAKIRLESDDPFYKLSKVVNEIGVHERHQIHVLQNKQSELEAIVDNLPGGVLVINRHRELQMANAFAFDLLNITGLDVPHPYTMDIRNRELKDLIDSVFESHQSDRKTITIQGEGASQPSIFETSVVYSPKVHHKFEIIVLMYDVTATIRAKQIEQDFVNNASHELRTPITAIAGFADTLLDGAKDDPKALDSFLQVIKSESDKLVQLTDDILTMSAVKNIKKDYKQVNLNNYVQQQLNLVTANCEKLHLKVNNLIPMDINEVVVENDLFQITKNLITNAIRYNRPNGNLDISYKSYHDGFDLIFKDTGIGIPENQEKRVFERFYRVNNEVKGGTGLGLAIVKEAVKDMNGNVKIESKVGKGTTVTVHFKRKI